MSWAAREPFCSKLSAALGRGVAAVGVNRKRLKPGSSLAVPRLQRQREFRSRVIAGKSRVTHVKTRVSYARHHQIVLRLIFSSGASGRSDYEEEKVFRQLVSGAYEETRCGLVLPTTPRA